LAEAGLKRVNISIDTLDPEKFQRLTRWGNVDDVWRAIRATEDAGFDPDQAECGGGAPLQRPSRT
jgi:cyclic pyranopterin phosphate synthase